MTNRQWTLTDAPIERMPTLANFALRESPVPVPGPGQALARTVYISLDPYQWGYKVKGLERPGDVLHARTVAQVETSNTPDWQPGDFVHCLNGWSEYGLIGAGVPEHAYMKTRRIDPSLGHPSLALGVLGMNGLTAYAGLLVQGQPEPGETVVVSAATGGVGQIVGQLAKIRGCRVVGIVSTEEKMRVAREDLGYDAAVSHLSPDLPGDLAKACPDGVDVYFENVGGRLFDATAALFNQGARRLLREGEGRASRPLGRPARRAPRHGQRAFRGRFRGQPFRPLPRRCLPLVCRGPDSLPRGHPRRDRKCARRLYRHDAGRKPRQDDDPRLGRGLSARADGVTGFMRRCIGHGRPQRGRVRSKISGSCGIGANSSFTRGSWPGISSSGRPASRFTASCPSSCRATSAVTGKGSPREMLS